MSSARVVLAAVEFVDASADYDANQHTEQRLWKRANDRLKRAEMQLKRSVEKYRGTKIVGHAIVVPPGTKIGRIRKMRFDDAYIGQQFGVRKSPKKAKK